MRNRSRAHLRLAGALVACVASAAACAPPDAPGHAVDSLPPDVVELLAPDTVRSDAVVPGVVHHFLRSPDGPLAVHLLEVDLARCGLALDLGLPGGAGEGDAGLEPLSAIAAGHEGVVIAAVNGDFFTPEGRPIGAEAGPAGVRGSQRSAALAWREGGELWIGPVEVEPGTGSVRGPEWRVPEGERGGVQLIGGRPELLDGGERVGDLEVAARPEFAAERHPRTAVGIAGKRLWIVTVDGRRDGHSVGMTLDELTGLMEALAVEEALNLDGGGSTAMYLAGRIVNRPSGLMGERAVVNALLVVHDPEGCH
ncbi:MAG: phosphodiester glycosidase family protein [Longimicrobiales bacterium]|nr:phosphodiester glycosidase family protein [Longimicrobiales bacterium]